MSSPQDSKPHIILVAYYYPPLNVIGALRPFRLYKYLTRMGYTFDVVTATAQTAPSLDIHYVPDETAGLWEGNDVAAQPSLAYQFERIVRKLALPGHVGLSWSWKAADMIHQLTQRRQGKKVVLITTYPPISVLIAGILAFKKIGLPWIADFRDPMACDPNLPARPALLRHVLSRIEIMTFQRAAAVIANTSIAGDIWKRAYPNHAHKVSVIWNGYDAEDQPRALPIPERDYRLLVHTGSLYGGRNANTLVEALWRIRRRQDGPAVRLKLVGDTGAESGVDNEAYRQAMDEGLLEFVPQRVPRAEAHRMAGEADGLVLIAPSKVTVVAKLYDYICIGRPILAIAYSDSAVNKILEKSGIPNVCIPPDAAAEALDRSILDYLSLPSEPTSPSDWFRSQFDVSHHAKQVAAIIDRIAV